MRDRERESYIYIYIIYTYTHGQALKQAREHDLSDQRTRTRGNETSRSEREHDLAGGNTESVCV